MPIPSDLKRLTALFHDLGASDPEFWARSQIKEGIPQLHRFLFLRQAWQCVLKEGDVEWLEEERRTAESDAGRDLDGVGQAAGRLLAAGVRAEDLTQLVRGMQARLLFQLCYLLSDPSLLEPELDGIGWALVSDDDDGQDPKPLQALHESVFSTDPAGPRKQARQGS
jgi:hypothetical protein